MRQIITLLLAALVTSIVKAETPQTAINAIVRSRPAVNRMIWYWYDKAGQRESLRLRIQTDRENLTADEIDRLRQSFMTVWSSTDFSAGEGLIYMGPDTMSMTITGNEKMATFDLGRASISADYAFNASAKMSGPAPDFADLLSAFGSVRAGKAVETTDVLYTGFMPGIVFTFQRGQGAGWTRGVRTTIAGASMADFNLLRGAMRKFIGSKVPVTVFDRTLCVMVKSESTPAFYAVGFDPATHQLNFLSATVENEICVPLDWQKIDYITNTEIRYRQ